MDARLFGDAIRSATVTYPIPFIFAVLLLFALLCLGGSALVAEGLRTLFAVIGTGSAISAIGLVAYALRSKPELLRSEHHVERMTMARLIGDNEMDPAVRTSLAKRIGPETKLRIGRGDQDGRDR